MTKIAISDDHRLVTEGLKSIIQRNNENQIVADAGSITDCDKLLRETPDLDVLLLDIGMPDGNSLDHICGWRKKYSQVKILVVSVYAEAAMIKRAIENGASGYILKTASDEELLEGIKQVMEGKVFLCKEAKELLKKDINVKTVQLTPREKEVLKLIVEGLSIKMIADRLNLSFETVHSYFKYIKLKLGVNNTAALVRVALEQKLV